MFAYCNNNPVNKVDSYGGIPFSTTLVKATRVEESEEKSDIESQQFVVIIDYTIIFGDTDSPLYSSSNDYSASFVFSIRNGIVQIDNYQPSMSAIFDMQIGLALSKAIIEYVKGINTELLQGRSAIGVYFEMLMHYGGHITGLYKNAHVTDIGGINEGYGGDRNAYIFENPIKHFGEFLSLFIP